MTEQAAGSSAEEPLFFKWVHNEDDSINWAKIILMLGLTVLTGYLSVQSQRAASSPDFNRTIRMGLAQKKITLGVKVQRIGMRLENAGWTAYEQLRQ